MSSNLYWRPFGSGEKLLPKELKYAMQKNSKYSSGIDIRLNGSDRSYFEGLRDAGVPGTDKLLEALERYEEIELKEVW
jgi:hypothetical protein